jgi:FixJ family two-component response regulator
VTRDDHMIYIVDDDSDVLDAIANLLSSCGFLATTFHSATDYLSAAKPAVPGCLILDLLLPDINGLELQRRLAGSNHPPIVFITGYGDVPTSVHALKAGAADFLPKPFTQESLLKAVESALAHHRRWHAVAAQDNQLRMRYESLTSRERQVLRLIVGGLLNKQAAARLGISIVTLQIHRAHVMRKMGARSFANLVRMATRLNLAVDSEPSSGPPPSPSPIGAGRRTPLTFASSLDPQSRS